MRLRFSIRDLLWLTLVVGLVFGWIVDNRRKSREQDDLVRQIGTLNADVQKAEQRADLWQYKLKLRVMGKMSDAEEGELQKLLSRN